MPVIRAHLRLSLDIVANSVKDGSGKDPYSQRSPKEQHKVKMKLLENLSDEMLLEWLDVWDDLTIRVDDDYQESSPKVPVLIKSQFLMAKEDLEKSLGFSLDAGLLCNGQPCTKQADCSHDCRHLYQTMKVPAGAVDGAKKEVWIVEHDGVEAWVITSLEWRSAKMVRDEHDHDGHDHSDHDHGGDDDDRARSAAAGRTPR